MSDIIIITKLPRLPPTHTVFFKMTYFIYSLDFLIIQNIITSESSEKITKDEKLPLYIHFDKTACNKNIFLRNEKSNFKVWDLQNVFMNLF